MSHAEDHHGGSPFIQHHFDDAEHQFQAGKLGIWLFLVTEILFFSGLFVAYILYRAQHPEIFEYAHRYLDKTLGAVNTAVLICSSLTAAWAVRAAQKNQKKLLSFCLIFTALAAYAFLGIKYKEYAHKFHHGTLWGCRFVPEEDPSGRELKPVLPAPECAKEGFTAPKPVPGKVYDGELPPPNTGMFFSIYFGMTGLHGIHVFIGSLIFIWLFLRSLRGDFEPEYYGPVDYAALYWHLVNLIWIYLFPMLYLIH